MAVNFCLPQYSPAITCHQLSADDYDVANLISSDPQQLKRGFRAEHFIRPPIEIIVSFRYCIDVSHIILGVRSGTQQTSDVKLFSQYPKFRGRVKGFQFIGKCENTTCRKLHFQNSEYSPRNPFTKFLTPSDACRETEVLKLDLKKDGNISCIQNLKICLVRVANSGVAVLSELQVWGQPSRMCDSDLIEKCFIIATKSSCILSKPPVKESHDAVQSVTATTEDHEASGSDIPSEFLDSITHEIMALPMVLPSGNVVDQQTIEKCNRAQEIYGRAPIDPFTGIPYHGENQPAFNAALKARIDEFLVRKGSSLNVPRSTGTRENVPRKVYKSSIYSSVPASSKAQSGVLDRNYQSALENSTQAKPGCFKSSKRTSVFEKDDLNKRKKCTNGMQLKYSDVSNSRKDPSASASEGIPLETTCEEKRKESLKAAVQELLGTTRRFTNFSKPAKSQVTKCAVCGVEFALSVFQLPCTHIICRNCMTSKLQTSASPTCDICNTAFSSNCVERVFL